MLLMPGMPAQLRTSPLDILRLFENVELSTISLDQATTTETDTHIRSSEKITAQPSSVP